MTDAHICNQTIQDDQNTTTEASDNCTIDDASNDFLHQEDCRSKDVISIEKSNDEQNETESSNTDYKISDKLDENCENVNVNINLVNKQTEQVKNKDMVLKYVYKKTDTKNNNKTKGHVKNSLKRKKRSLISDSELHARQPRRFQINDLQKEREELAVPQTKPQGVINRDDLADFNIETLHENIKPSIGILMKGSQGFVNKPNPHIKEYQSDDSESNEHDISKIKVKSTEYDNNDTLDKYVKKSKNVENKGIIKDDGNLSQSDEDNEDYKKYEKNIKSAVYDKDNSNNDNIDESRNVENSNKYTEEGRKKLSQNVKDESSEFSPKNIKNIKSSAIDKDEGSNDYPKESNDNDDSGEYHVKDKENIESSVSENDKTNKQFYTEKDSQDVSDDKYLLDYKETSKSDESSNADSFERSLPISKDNIREKNEDILKKQHTNYNSDIINNNDLSKDERNSKETSSESKEKVDDIEESKLLNEDNKDVFTSNKKRNNSINFDEVDLDDFSYESIQDEKDQTNEPIVNLKNKNERSSLSENVAIIPNTLERPSIGTNSENSSLNENIHKYEKQIKINDDEIKPVKELNNSESQSEEESEEYKESEKSEDKEESINDRLKSVVEKSHKLYPISKAANKKDNIDVKAQFERIPENYKHTDAENTTEKPVVISSDEEGTVDSFTRNNEYDKDLNIKFSDLTVTLPEIKLPKDILAYTHEETKKKNDRKDEDDSEDKDKYNSGEKYRDNSEEKEKEQEEEEEEELEEEYIKKPKLNRNNKENGDDFYQSYFNPSVDLFADNPKEKDKYSSFNVHENSGEDLYEKFVRERFGKRSNLKKKSEKLTDYEPLSKNPNLYKNVRKVLKKANKIEKEAAKRKDPNYMWTLEYGGKL